MRDLRSLAVAIVAGILLAGGFPAPALAGTDASAREGNISIAHKPVTSAKRGEPVEIVATITSSAAIGLARIWYRTSDTGFTAEPLVPDGSDRYSGRIPSAATGGEWVEYYLEAYDLENDRALDPPDFQAEPRRVVLYDLFSPEMVTAVLVIVALGIPFGIVALLWRRRRKRHAAPPPAFFGSERTSEQLRRI